MLDQRCGAGMSGARRASWGLAVLIFLGAAVSVWSWQVPEGASCAESATYPEMGITICRKYANPQSEFNALQFSPNNLFRIPPDERPPIAGGEPGDPCAGDRCYAQSMMGWTPAHATCAKGARIGVISSGIDARHPAFAGTAFSRQDFTPHQPGHTSPWHGTALFALLAGNSSGRVEGLVPQATFSVADAFFADGQGVPVADVLSLLKALNWMTTQNLHVVLLDMTGPRDPLVDEAISALVKTGAAVVMPAGADENAASAHPDVIAVAAVDNQMVASKGAPTLSRIDLVAPGVDIWTALPGDKYGYVSGNSFASAYVTATLATAQRLEPSPSAAEVRERALAHLPVKDLGAGHGRGLAMAATDCVPRFLPATPLPLRMPTVDHTPWQSTVRAE